MSRTKTVSNEYIYSINCIYWVFIKENFVLKPDGHTLVMIIRHFLYLSPKSIKPDGACSVNQTFQCDMEWKGGDGKGQHFYANKVCPKIILPEKVYKF